MKIVQFECYVSIDAIVERDDGARVTLQDVVRESAAIVYWGENLEEVVTDAIVHLQSIAGHGNHHREIVLKVAERRFALREVAHE